MESLPPWYFVGMGLMFGLVIGSFLNVVIHRLPLMLKQQWQRECAEINNLDLADAEPRISLWLPGSRCPSCKTPIKPRHNVPLVGYLMLKGRCAACDTPIGLRYPTVELITGVLTAAVVWRFGMTLEMLAAAVLTWSLVALSVIDIDHQLLPDNITLPLAWLGLLVSVAALFATPTDAIIGAVSGYLVLWIVFQLFLLLTGKEGMGFGDFKLLAVLGAWLGWQMLPQIVLVSSLTGAVVGITIMSLGKQAKGQPIPFGPFLAVAGWIALMWGKEINQAYLAFSGF